MACLVGLLSGCGDNGGDRGDDGPQAIEVRVNTSTTKAHDLRGLAFAKSGKVYAAGHTDADPADRKTVVARFNADGTPDTTFDGDGFVELNVVEGGGEQTLSIVELANNDIVIGVNASDKNGGELITAGDDPTKTRARVEGISIYLVRLSSAGAPVNAFGPEGNGRAEVVFGWANADNDEWPVPAYTFATNTFSHAGFPTDQAWDIRLDPRSGAERLVVFGFGSAVKAATGAQRVDNDRFVARILADTGAADPSFNGGQAFTLNSAGTFADNARRGVVEADGTIVSAGYTNLGGSLGNHVVLMRLSTAGALDSTFAGFSTEPATVPARAGIAVFNPFKVDGGVAECYAAEKQSSGNYVTTGYGSVTAAGRASSLGYVTTTGPDLVTFRTSDSALDTAWGRSGTQSFQSENQGRPTTEDRGRDLVVLGDDRTIQAGRYGGNAALFVTTPDGDLDPSVDEDGILELPNTTITGQFFNVELSADKKRIAATTSSDAAGSPGARLVILSLIDN